MLKVFIISGNTNYHNLFMNMGFEIISNLKEDVPDLVVFTGGEDVDPALYKEKSHPRTFYSRYRDMQEKELFKEFLEMDIPMVGICRGGQFLNVMNGGRMFQHVSNHTRDHYIIDTETKKKIFSTSTHHQMMRPSESAVVLSVAYEGGKKESMEKGYPTDHLDEVEDIEAVFYPHTKCLCFQPHPEFGTTELQEYFASLVSKYLIN